MIRALTLVSLLLCCTSCVKWIDAPHKYNLGDKVLLKTGDTAVITHISYHKVREDFQVKHQRYTVRVAFIKRVNHDFLNGRTETDVGTFTVFEYEIEKVIE